jgi:hypothetical protein
VAVVVAVALATGLVAGFLLPRFLPARGRSTSTGSASSRWSTGRPAIADEQQAGLGRRTIDSLRAGVVVLDDNDVPVLINPAARAMGLLRTGSTPGSIAAHPLIRTLAGQATARGRTRWACTCGPWVSGTGSSRSRRST